MEVPWHEVPDIWRKDYEELAVSFPSRSYG